jgi:hypothetical protein
MAFQNLRPANISRKDVCCALKRDDGPIVTEGISIVGDPVAGFWVVCFSQFDPPSSNSESGGASSRASWVHFSSKPASREPFRGRISLQSILCKLEDIVVSHLRMEGGTSRVEK